MVRTRLLLVLLTSCTTHAPTPTAAPVRLPCRPLTVRIVDEAARPVTGARVRTVTTKLRSGASAAEVSWLETEESPEVTTDAGGAATVCQAVPGHASIVVHHLDWPEARVPAEQREVRIGPARRAVVAVPVALTCNREERVRVTADAEPVTTTVRGTPGPLHHFTLTGLGPWRYWVRSEACDETVVRALDARKLPAVLTMDRNDSVVDYPEFAGGTATVNVFRDTSPLVTATLDAEGVAVLALPGSSGTVYCMKLEKAGRCLVTFTRVGEVARPGKYADRGDALARDCALCP